MKLNKLTPVEICDYWAARTIKEFRDNVPKAGLSANKLFKYANQYGIHGQAFASFKNSSSTTKQFNQGMFPPQFKRELNKNKELRKQFSIFEKELAEKYPNSLMKRAAIAVCGGVVKGTVTPKSYTRKLLVVFDLICENTLEKCSNLAKKIKKIFKQKN